VRLPVVVVASVLSIVAISTCVDSHAWAQPVQPPAACHGSLDGHVVDVATHVPVAGAVISIGGSDVAVSNEAGRFTLRDLCAGDITLGVALDNYLPDERQIRLASDADAVSVEVELIKLDMPTEVIEVEDVAPPDVDMRSTAKKSGEALERTRGRAFADVLTDIPGVSQLRSASGSAKPIIRGQYGRRLLILVDGVRHRAQEWGLDHAPEIDPFIADSIEVVRGASGVRLGPDAIGGAVLVAPPPLLRAPGYSGELHLIGLTNTPGATVNARILGADRRFPGYAAMLEGSLRRSGGVATPDYPLDNTGALEWNLGATGGYSHGDSTYRLSYRHYQARLGVCSCLRVDSIDDFLAQLGADEPRNADLYGSDYAIDRPYQAVSHDLALARASWYRDGLGSLTVSYAFQHDLRNEFDVVRDPANTAPQFHFRLYTHDLDASVEHRPIHLNAHWHVRGSAGVVGMVQTHRYSGLQLVPDHDAFGAGLFAVERLVGHVVEIEAGVRYDVLHRSAGIQYRDFARLVRSDQIAMDACGTITSTDPESQVDCASTFHVPSLSLGALRRLGDAWSLKLDLSTATRPPNPDEQYLNGSSPTFPVLALGKPDLGPETTYSSSFTVAVETPRLRGEASIYGNLIDDYINFQPAVDEMGQPIFDVLIRGAFPRFVTRPVDAVFYGADGGVSATPLSWLELGGQLSIVRARNRTNDSYLVFVPPPRASGTVTVRRDELAGARNVFATLSGEYVARQDRFDIRADLAPPPDAHFLLGAEAGIELSAGDRVFKVAVQGSNLTNARYRDYTSLLRYFADQPGWEAVLRLSVHFKSHEPAS
jgi:iron complex outermembrane recepter protein